MQRDCRDVSFEKYPGYINDNLIKINLKYMYGMHIISNFEG